MKITHLKDRSPHHLSTGEKKRVTLASVLVLDPEVLLLDEPTAALDPKSASQMIDFLIGLRGGPKTVITSTHDLDIVEDIADQCFVFQTGRVVAAGTPTEILQPDFHCWSKPTSCTPIGTFMPPAKLIRTRTCIPTNIERRVAALR